MRRRGSTEAQKGARQGSLVSQPRAALQQVSPAGPWQAPPDPILDLIMEHLLAGEEGARWVSGSPKCLPLPLPLPVVLPLLHTATVVPADVLASSPARSGAPAWPALPVSPTMTLTRVFFAAPSCQPRVLLLAGCCPGGAACRHRHLQAPPGCVSGNRQGLRCALLPGLLGMLRMLALFLFSLPKAC